MSATKRLVEELSWEDVQKDMDAFFQQKEQEYFQMQLASLDAMDKEQQRSINIKKQQDGKTSI